MSLFATLQEKRRERKKECDANTQLIIEANKRKPGERSLSKEENEKFNQRDAVVVALEADIERIETQLQREQKAIAVRDDGRKGGREDFDGRADPRVNPLGIGGEKRELTPEQLHTRDIGMRVWMLNPAALTAEHREVMEFSQVGATEISSEVRALSGITGSLGAYTIPTGFAYKIDVALKAFGGMMAESEIIPTQQGNDFYYPTVNDTANTGEVIQENQGVGGSDANPSGEQDPAWGVVTFRAYAFDSTIIRVPFTFIEDTGFDIEAQLSEWCQTRLGRKINYATTNGLGANYPTGIVPASPVGVTTASGIAFTYNELLTLTESIDPLYQPGAKWMFNQQTKLAFKKLADANGRPIWIAGGVSEGVQNDAPDTFAGYKYTLNQDMPSIAQNSTPIIFGQLKKYKIRKVRDYQLVRFSERFADKLQVGIMVWVRIDGNLVDAGTHPVKKLQTANAPS